MNDASMPPEIDDEDGQEPRIPWWLTDSGMARMRELEQVMHELRNEQEKRDKCLSS